MHQDQDGLILHKFIAPDPGWAGAVFSGNWHGARWLERLDLFYEIEYSAALRISEGSETLKLKFLTTSIHRLMHHHLSLINLLRL